MLTVAAGAPFDVELGVAPNIGCMWEPVALPDGVRLLATRFSERLEPPVEDAGTQVFELQALQRGRLQLRFVLKRRWEQTPIQSRSIDVDVR